MSAGIDQITFQMKDAYIRIIEHDLATISLVESDHSFTSKWGRAEFDNEAHNLREALHDLYRTIRHEDVSLKTIRDIAASLDQIKVIYKPIIDEYKNYEKYHLLR